MSAPSTYTLYGETVASSFDFASNVLKAPWGEEPTLTFDLGPPPPGVREGGQLLYESGALNEQGRSSATLTRRGDVDVFTFAQAASFFIERDRVTCDLTDLSWAHGVEVWFLGAVMAYWLERKGIPALHGSAVVVPEGSIAFLGTGGSGKSSLALAFLKGGHPLLTDDILAVEQRDGQWWGRPGYPQMRVWADQARYVGRDHAELSRVQPHGEKRRLTIGSGGLGQFHATAAPLVALYVPERGEVSGEMVVAPMRGVEAISALVRHSFLASLLLGSGLQPPRLQRLAALVNTVPVRRLQYPEGFERLGAVREAVRKDLREG